jgi:hypothetical protein
MNVKSSAKQLPTMFRFMAHPFLARNRYRFVALKARHHGLCRVGGAPCLYVRDVSGVGIQVDEHVAGLLVEPAAHPCREDGGVCRRQCQILGAGDTSHIHGHLRMRRGRAGQARQHQTEHRFFMVHSLVVDRVPLCWVYRIGSRFRWIARSIIDACPRNNLDLSQEAAERSVRTLFRCPIDGQPREENNAQIDCCGRLRLIGCNFGTRHDACTACSARRHGDTNCRRLRPRQNANRGRMRGTHDRPSDPPRRSQVCSVAGWCLRWIRVNALDWHAIHC